MTRIIFLILYLVGMVPTYILPYFGSNSVLAQTASALISRSGIGLTGTMLHVGSLALCLFVAWARGAVSGKRALDALPAVAAIFDLVPVLSAIPMVPTVLHILTLVQGFSRNDTLDDNAPGLAQRPLPGVLLICSLTAIAAAATGIYGASKIAGQTNEPNSKAFSALREKSPDQITVPTTPLRLNAVNAPPVPEAPPRASATSHTTDRGELSILIVEGTACPSDA